MHRCYSTGYIAAYIGGGKGKTTAAIGQIVRAAGHDISCRFIQFMKDGRSGEVIMLSHLPGVSAVSYGLDEFYIPGTSDILKHRKYCKDGLIDAGEYTADLLVLDEVLDTVSLGLVPENELIELVEKKPSHVELILTGRELSAGIEPLCSLISEIQCVRHYYDSGITAREGIEY